ncbi:GNAT family N-acetyltransferase [Streptacidiphilus pinicola]|uniref:GNAT family N-acetyltransferase n=1 Tax=Streptacidiphilus pinicola TaxID=2219663 RepID=A0A2X0IUF5_9ACTN|nr:GNAT family N-acetyltransferase [Streptacidiphilus pinicola]RAG87253.1 GNAT family N-acetyltransferase [Streptacidiphilus pinicola]
MSASDDPNSPDSRDAVARVGETRWLALDGGREAGRGDACRRPDGRMFVSVDAWESPVFDRLAAAIVADLPAPLHAVVDADDPDTVAAWQRAGLVIGRREREYVVPTDPRVTGLDAVRAPEGVTIVPLGQAREAPLRALDRAIRAEVEAGVGWRTMPAEVLPRPEGVTVVDPAKYAVADADGRYVGLVRVAPVTRRPRIGLIAVLAEQQRRGIARALLAEVLGSLHDAGTETVWAEADESNIAARTLMERVNARCSGGILEMVSATEKSQCD